MKTIEQRLRERGAAPVLFISDPTGGDQFVFGGLEELETHPVPDTAEGHEISTGEDFANNLDFGAYDEPPAVVEL